MTRLKALDSNDANSKSKELFDSVKSKMGMVPNMMKTMGTSPAVLNGYLGLSTALNNAKIGNKLGQLISLAIANDNGCDYCNSAHSFIAGKIGISDSDIENARQGQSSDPMTAAALEFAKEIVSTRGKVSNESVEKIKQAGYDEEAIAEIIATVSLNIFTNYFNNVAGTEIDFPKVSPINN